MEENMHEKIKYSERIIKGLLDRNDLVKIRNIHAAQLSEFIMKNQ